MASSSLHPPAIVHVASNISEKSNQLQLHARCRTPSLHPDEDPYDDEDMILDEGVSVAWTDSPLSSCPNSPPRSPPHLDLDDDDNDDGVIPQPATTTTTLNNAYALMDLSSSAARGATAYVLSRQDSQLGARESRLERLKLEHQSRLLLAAASLEEKKTDEVDEAIISSINYNDHYQHYWTIDAATGRQESSTNSGNDVRTTMEEPPADSGVLPNSSERSRATLRMRLNLSSTQQHPSNVTAISVEDSIDGGVEVVPTTTMTFSVAEEDPGEIPLTLEKNRVLAVNPIVLLDEVDGSLAGAVVPLSLDKESAYSVPWLPEVDILMPAQDEEEEAEMVHRSDDYSVPMDESIGESVPMDEDRVGASLISVDNNDPSHLTLQPRIQEFDKEILLDAVTAESPKVSPPAVATSTSKTLRSLKGSDASAVYTMSNQHLKIINLVDRDVPLDELQEDYHEEEMSPRPPSSLSSNNHLDSVSVKSIPMDEVDEFVTPPPQRLHEQIMDRRDYAEDQHCQAMRCLDESQCEEDHDQQSDQSDIAVHQPREYGKHAEQLQQGDTEQQSSQYLSFDSDRWSIPIVATAPTGEFGACAVTFKSQELEMESFQTSDVPSFDEFDDDLVPVNWNPLEESCLESIENETRNATLSPRTTNIRGCEAAAVSPPVRITPVFPSSRIQQPQHWDNNQHGSRFSWQQTSPVSRSRHHPYSTLITTSTSADARNTDKSGVRHDESVEVIPEDDTVEIIHCHPDDFEQLDSSSAPEDELVTARQSMASASPKKSPVSKKVKSAQIRDITDATMSEEESEISRDRASYGYTIHQHRQQNSLESDDQPSDDNVGPLPDLELRRPLFPHDDVSSSDETPITSNSLSGLTRPRRAGGHHNDWNSVNQDYYSKHPRGQRRKRMRKKILKRRASDGKNSKKRPVKEQSSLPALVVDHDQLRAIGVKTLMSVCNGIGSLFLTAAASSSDTKQLLPGPKAPYQKMSPERPSPSRLTPIPRQQFPKSLSKSLSPSRSRLHREAANVDSCPVDQVAAAEKAGAAVFREAFQQSVRAEQESHSVQRQPIRSNKRKTVAVKTSECENGRSQSIPPDQRQSGKKERQCHEEVNREQQQVSTHPPHWNKVPQPQRQHIGTGLDEVDRKLSQRISPLSCLTVGGSRSEQRNDSVSTESKSLQAPEPMKKLEASLADQFTNPSQEHSKMKNGQKTHPKDGQSKRSVTRHNFSEGWPIETKVGSRRMLAYGQSAEPQELESLAEKEMLHPKTGSESQTEKKRYSPEMEAFESTPMDIADWSIARDAETVASSRSAVDELLGSQSNTGNDERTTTRLSSLELQDEEIACLETETSLPRKYYETTAADEETSTSSEPSSSVKWLQAVLEIALRSRGKDISELPRKLSVKPESSSRTVIAHISEPPVVHRVNVSLNLEESINTGDLPGVANADGLRLDDQDIATSSNDNEMPAHLKSIVATSERIEYESIDRVGALQPSTCRRAASESDVENVDAKSIMCHFQPAEPAVSAPALFNGTPAVSIRPHFVETTTNNRSENGDCDESVHVHEKSLKPAASSPEAELYKISAEATTQKEDDKKLSGCLAHDSCDVGAIQESRVLDRVVSQHSEDKAFAPETSVIACRSLSVLDEYDTEVVLEQFENEERLTESGRSHEFGFNSTPTFHSSETLQELAREVDGNDTEKRNSNGYCCSQDSDIESDESTDKLMIQLTDMIKDLDGLVGSRRIERSFTEESFATTFSTPTVAENSNADVRALISSESPEYVSGAMPALIKSLSNDIGIPKGDIVISLLNNNLSEPGSWSNRVDEAIWRCRTMRRNLSTKWQEKKASRKSRTNLLSVRIDVDDVRVVGGIDKIAGTQETAFDYLEYDDLDDALALYESINLSCETFVDAMQPDQAEKCKAIVASTFHNLGIIYMLRGEFDDALPCFEQATYLLAEFHGPGHIDHVVSNLGALYFRCFAAKANTCFVHSGIIG